MLNLSPNTQKPTVYTNFLLGSRTCFFLFFGHLSWASEGVWVLGFGIGIAFCFSPVQQGTFGMAWHGMESLVLYTTQRPCNWKTRCFKLYPLIRDAACMFLLEPAIDFHLRIIGRPIEYMPSDFVSLCSFHPSARGSTYLPRQ
jgi:hypothetical protein